MYTRVIIRLFGRGFRDVGKIVSPRRQSDYFLEFIYFFSFFFLFAFSAVSTWSSARKQYFYPAKRTDRQRSKRGGLRCKLERTFFSFYWQIQKTRHNLRDNGFCFFRFFRDSTNTFSFENVRRILDQSNHSENFETLLRIVNLVFIAIRNVRRDFFFFWFYVNKTYVGPAPTHKKILPIFIFFV